MTQLGFGTKLGAESRRGEIHAEPGTCLRTPDGRPRESEEGGVVGGAQRLNILVVDRDPKTTDPLGAFLGSSGYAVRAVHEGGEALAEVKRGRYQIVILDLETERSDGTGLLREIRAIDSDLCVIAITAAPSVKSAVSSMKSRAFDYLCKPLDLEELHRVLGEAIRENGLLIDVEQKLNIELGRRVRERRTDRGLTLKQLANRTSLSVSLISQIELGKSAASLSTLQKLATALGVRMTYFFEMV